MQCNVTCLRNLFLLKKGFMSGRYITCAVFSAKNLRQGITFSNMHKVIIHHISCFRLHPIFSVPMEWFFLCWQVGSAVQGVLREGRTAIAGGARPGRVAPRPLPRQDVRPAVSTALWLCHVTGFRPLHRFPSLRHLAARECSPRHARRSAAISVPSAVA